MSPGCSVAILWAGAALAMTAGWAWQVRRENAGIVDLIWTGGIGAAAVWYAAVLDGAALPRALVALLGALWSLRLAAHLAPRVLNGAEDGRYHQLRLHWRGHQRKMVGMFQFQALLIVLFSLPFLAVARNPRADLTPWMVAGIAVWVGSVCGEALADRELARFRADPANRGRTCRAGLWRYSRHPNYFFEWLGWLAWPIIAIDLGEAWPWGWLALTGPALMFLILRFASGVPPTEAAMARSRGEAFGRYQARVSVFFPLPPKPKPHKTGPAPTPASGGA